MRGKIKILFVYPSLSSFVKADLEIFQRHFDVIPHQWTRTRDIKNVLRIIWHILRTDLGFIWFAGGHAARVVFLSKLFRKRTIVVASGYSVANMPEINYGLMLSPKSAHYVIYALKKADKVLAVSEFNKKEILKHAHPKDIELVYHGVNHNKFKPQGEKEENLVITVGAVTNSNLKRKGLETFVRAAKFLPDVKFMLIGNHFDSVRYLKSIASANVKFTGFVSDDDLLKYYQEAKVYVQVSAHEGFGLSLTEAMLCECVPVVTNRAALPEVVGDTGFYVPYGDPKATAEAIKKALNSNKGKEARERIKNMFPLEQRKKKLISEIKSLLQK
jgi:glycosyltransferase involved in cell wall biosynthesis